MVNGRYAVINGRVGGVLSRLKIDTDKDWAAKKIQALGSPDTGNDAARDDTIDGKIATHDTNVTDSHGRIAGILPAGQIPGLAASKIISGILAVARIPDLAADKITSGVLALARIPTGIQGKLTGACPYQYSHPGSPVCSGCPHPSGRYSHPTTGTCPQAPKAHTLASHSTKAHAELTGVTADQHHTKFTTTEHDVVARHPLSVLDSAVCSETEAVAKVTFENLDAKGDVGTGAAQVAAGDHTHTLQQDVLGSAVAGVEGGGSWAGYRTSFIIAGSGDLNVATTTPTFAALSRAVGVAIVTGAAGTLNDLKLRLIMGGTQVAESGYLSLSTVITVVKGTRALSGSQSVIARIHNYDGSTQAFYSYNRTSNEKKGACVAVGSVKI